MTTDNHSRWLAFSLLLALCSNAVLLFIIACNTSKNVSPPNHNIHGEIHPNSLPGGDLHTKPTHSQSASEKGEQLSSQTDRVNADGSSHKTITARSHQMLYKRIRRIYDKIHHDISLMQQTATSITNEETEKDVHSEISFSEVLSKTKFNLPGSNILHKDSIRDTQGLNKELFYDIYKRYYDAVVSNLKHRVLTFGDRHDKDHSARRRRDVSLVNDTASKEAPSGDEDVHREAPSIDDTDSGEVSSGNDTTRKKVTPSSDDHVSTVAPSNDDASNRKVTPGIKAVRRKTRYSNDTTDVEASSSNNAPNTPVPSDDKINNKEAPSRNKVNSRVASSGDKVKSKKAPSSDDVDGKEAPSHDKLDNKVAPSGENANSKAAPSTGKIDSKVVPSGDDASSYLSLGSIFSFTEDDMSNFTTPVSDLLIPALVSFEDKVIRQLDEMHYVILSQDLRLEETEKTLLNLAASAIGSNKKGRGQRRGDQRTTSLDSDIIDSLAEISVTLQSLGGNNVSKLENESSGEIGLNLTSPNTTAATTTTTTRRSTSTTTTTTTTQPVAYYDLLREMSEMQQKVHALQNYNTMSDSELTRVRKEVTKMDDKVIEMRRKQKNLQLVTGHHTFKITELEMQMSRNDVALNTALDAYGRINSRVENFKDRLTDFSREVHTINVQFMRQQQISSELRAADSYKAHDIQEIRKTMQGIETRLNDLYSHLDQNINSARNDFRDWLDRLCMNNKLAC